MRPPRPTPLVCALIALAGLARPAGAADAPRSDRFFWRQWRVDDGLPDNVVNKLIVGRDGFLWIAEETGLSRFDGAAFRRYPLASSLPEGHYNIRAAAADPAGGLLLLPASGGLVHFAAGRYDRHPLSRLLEGQSAVDLFVPARDDIWIALYDGTLLHRKDGRDETFPHPIEPPRRGRGRFTFASASDGTVWIACANFLAEYRAGRLTTAARPNDISAEFVVAQGASGTVWISSHHALKRRRHNATDTVLAGPQWAAGADDVQAMYEDRGGALWIATRRGGLYRWGGQQLDHVSSRPQWISSLTEDDAGDIWYSSRGGGIGAISPKRFVRLGVDAGLATDLSNAVCEDREGNLWCANREGGVARYRDGRLTQIAIPSRQPDWFAWTVCCDQQDRVWIGASDGLYRIDAPGAAPHSLGGSLADVDMLFCARNGDTWVGAGNAVVGFYRGDVFHPLRLGTGASPPQTGWIAQDAAGAVWIAGEAGLAEVNGDLIVSRIPRETFSAGNLHTVLPGRPGELWLGSDRGLLLSRSGVIHRFSSEEGMPDEIVTQLLADNHGQIWIGTRKGLCRAPVAELEAVAEHRAQRVTAVLFGLADGLADGSSLGRAEPSAWKASDGRLWFATYGGVIGIDPSQMRTDRSPPPTFLDEVRVDGRPVAASDSVRVRAGAQRIDFVFTAPELGPAPSVEFRHRLEGFDRDWIATGTSRIATYTSLPPGNFRLSYAARISGGMWSGERNDLSLRVDTPWWKTVWANCLWMTAGGILLIAGARWQLSRKLANDLARLRREQELHAEKSRIARDLHDELGSAFTLIGLLAHRAKRACADSEAASALAELLRSVHGASCDLQSIVWALTPHEETLPRLAAFLSRYARRFFQESPIALDVSIPSPLPKVALSPAVQHHVTAATKEILNNVLRHSGADRATLSLTMEAATLVVTVRDDGRGFAADAGDPEGNGLANVRLRLGEIRGRIVIDSYPGKGALISLRVPLDGAAKLSRVARDGE